METFLAPLAVALAKAIFPAAVTAATAALAQGFAWLRGKTTSEVQSNALGLLNELVFTVVHDLTQTMAATLKATSPDGKLSAQDAQTIKNEALRKIQAYYSQANGLAYLAKVLRIPDNQILDLVASKIEAAVYATKSAQPDALPAFGGMTPSELAAAQAPTAKPSGMPTAPAPAGTP